MHTINMMKKLAFGRAIERGIASSIGFFGTLIMLVIAFYAGIKFNTVDIISIL